MLQCEHCRHVFETPRLVCEALEERLECPRCGAGEFRVLQAESGYTA